ncbi:MAG: formate dehydrogenase accessory sulfurtransferase FdhD, partial [bacterium]
MEKQQETRAAVVLKGADSTEEDIQIVRETPLTVYLNSQELITLVTTGDANRELALGFLLSEGFLTDREDLVSIDIDDEAGTANIKVSGDLSLIEDLWEKRTVTSGCGKGATFYSVLDSLQSKSVDSDLKLTPMQTYSLMTELIKMSDLYKSTRGVH